MGGTDGKLEREMREAFGKDLPGEEFVAGVLSRTERGSGGEHVLAVRSARTWRRAALRWAFVAAVLLMAVSVWLDLILALSPELRLGLSCAVAILVYNSL